MGVRQTLETRAIGTVCLDIRIRYPAELREAGVLSHHAVALAEDQVIAPGHTGSIAQPQMSAIKERHDLDQTEGTGNMRRLAGKCHPQNSLSQSPGIE